MSVVEISPLEKCITHLPILETGRTPVLVSSHLLPTTFTVYWVFFLKAVSLLWGLFHFHSLLSNKQKTVISLKLQIPVVCDRADLPGLSVNMPAWCCLHTRVAGSAAIKWKSAQTLRTRFRKPCSSHAGGPEKRKPALECSQQPLLQMANTAETDIHAGKSSSQWDHSPVCVRVSVSVSVCVTSYGLRCPSVSQEQLWGEGDSECRTLPIAGMSHSTQPDQSKDGNSEQGHLQPRDGWTSPQWQTGLSLAVINVTFLINLSKKQKYRLVPVMPSGHSCWSQTALQQCVCSWVLELSVWCAPLCFLFLCSWRSCDSPSLEVPRGLAVHFVWALA